VANGGAATPPSQGAELGDLTEIVVTARRIEERAQDVPISMTIFSQQQLTDHNIQTSGDLAAYTPSLSTGDFFGQQEVTTFSIRGFVQALGTTPSVAVYFADAVVPRGGNIGENAGSGVPPGSFFDLQNVEVLKGPQGTLFGRNTDGGAVLLVPKKPTSDFEG
jgi:iron complex outermembrane receptor protein